MFYIKISLTSYFVHFEGSHFKELNVLRMLMNKLMLFYLYTYLLVVFYNYTGEH